LSPLTAQRRYSAWLETLMRRSITLLLAAAAMLTACNTIGGAGKDLSSAGKAISKTAEDVKN
jgi:predicted small secreted protein